MPREASKSKSGLYNCQPSSSLRDDDHCQAELERLVLGVPLVRPEALDHLMERTQADYFAYPSHRTVYEAMRALYDRGEDVNFTTVVEALERKGRLNEVGGLAYLERLLEFPRSLDYGHYLKRFREHALRRRCIQVLGRYWDAFKDPERTPAEVIGDMEGELARLREEWGPDGQGGRVPIREVGLLRREDLDGHEAMGPTWLVEPILPSEAVVLLAAKYDSMKTWTALHLARQVLETTDRAVVYLDYDMMPIAVVRERLKATGLERYVGDRLKFHTGPGVTSLTALERWGEMVEAILSMPPGLLVIDSLKTWLIGVKLNSDSDVLPYLQSLLRLRSAGWTVLVIHHVPKAGDSDFKNTGSIGDAVDIIWRGQRAGGILKLEAKKRRIEVPASVGLDMSNPAWPVLLDGDVAERRSREARVLAFVRENPRATAEEISEGTGVPVGAIKRLLPDMTQRGLLAVEGSGKRGDPFRYSLPLPPELPSGTCPPNGDGTSDFGRESSTEAVIRNYHGRDSRSDTKNPESPIRIRGDHTENGGDPNPKHGENGGVTPNSGAGKFGSPHQTYIPDRKSR